LSAGAQKDVFEGFVDQSGRKVQRDHRQQVCFLLCRQFIPIEAQKNECALVCCNDLLSKVYQKHGFLRLSKNSTVLYLHITCHFHSITMLTISKADRLFVGQSSSAAGSITEKAVRLLTDLPGQHHLTLFIRLWRPQPV
jgi:hypothetical protein